MTGHLFTRINLYWFSPSKKIEFPRIDFLTSFLSLAYLFYFLPLLLQPAKLCFIREVGRYTDSNSERDRPSQNAHGNQQLTWQPPIGPCTEKPQHSEKHHKIAHTQLGKTAHKRDTQITKIANIHKNHKNCKHSTHTGSKKRSWWGPLFLQRTVFDKLHRHHQSLKLKTKHSSLNTGTQSFNPGPHTARGLNWDATRSD